MVSTPLPFFRAKDPLRMLAPNTQRALAAQIPCRLASRILTPLQPAGSRAAAMLTFRRALVAAAFFITVIFLTTRSSTPTPSEAPESFPRAQAYSDNLKKAATTAASDHNPLHGGPSRHRPSRSGQQAMQD